MIPAANGYMAVFGHDEDHQRYDTIVAWDDEGEPLIVGPKRLERASSFGDYRGVSLDGGWVRF